jgi:hypothetical protein
MDSSSPLSDAGGAAVGARVAAAGVQSDAGEGEEGEGEEGGRGREGMWVEAVIEEEDWGAIEMKEADRARLQSEELVAAAEAALQVSQRGERRGRRSIGAGMVAGTQFACFTGTKVQIMTQLRRRGASGHGRDRSREGGGRGGGVGSRERV